MLEMPFPQPEHFRIPPAILFKTSGDEVTGSAGLLFLVITKLVGFTFSTEKCVDSSLPVELLVEEDVLVADASYRRFLGCRGGFFEPTPFGAEVVATVLRFLPG